MPQHRRPLVLGHLLVGGIGSDHHGGGGENQSALVGAGYGQVDGDAHPFVEPGRRRGAGEHQPSVSGDAGFRCATGGVVGVRCGGADRKVLDTDESAEVARIDDDSALDFAHGQVGVGSDQPRGLVQVDVVHRRLERDFSHHRVIDAAGADLQLAITVPQGLGDEGKAEDCHPRIERQAGGGPDIARQLVLGVDRRTGVGTDGAGDDRKHHTRGRQQLSHPGIVPYRGFRPTESG